MEKSNLQLVIDDLNRKGFKFTTHTEWKKKFAQRLESEKLLESNQLVSENKSPKSKHREIQGNFKLT
jgi:hypothetical protein